MNFVCLQGKLLEGFFKGCEMMLEDLKPEITALKAKLVEMGDSL